MLHALQQYLLRSSSDGRCVREIGPFSLLLHPSSDHPYLNYAVPHAGAAPDHDEVVALVAAFAREARVPRLEFLPAVAPAVEAALRSAGFADEARLRLMACTPVERRAVPVPAGVRLVDVVPATDAAYALARVQAVAFGGTADDAAALGEDARTTTSPAVLAVADGTPAGGGQCQPTLDRTTEIVGVGVLGPYRRRGIAAAVTGHLVGRAFASGARLAVLTPGDEDTARVYARCGFRTQGEMLHTRLDRA